MVGLTVVVVVDVDVEVVVVVVTVTVVENCVVDAVVEDDDVDDIFVGGASPTSLTG